MNYLLDTCVVSELIRKKPSPTVLAWLEKTGETLLYLSVITLGEIEKGVIGLGSTTRAKEIEKWLKTDLLNRFEGRIIDIDTNIALTWGKILGDRQNKGKVMPTIDALFVATALKNEMALVTRNTKDMVYEGVELVNPWET